MRPWLLVALAACGTHGPEHASERPERAGALAFPRIASYIIDTRVDAAAVPVLARSDVVIVDAEAGANTRGSLDLIRACNPRGLLLAYLTSEEIKRAPADDMPLARARMARIPASEWLLEPGSTLAAPVSPTDTRLTVADGAAFHLHPPRSDFYPADEPTYLLVDDEHVKLVAIDGNTLTVERTQPVAHAAGAHIAAHVVFFSGTWMLDLADNAPGPRTWRDDLSDEYARLVAAGPWNGVFVDDCFSDIAWLDGGNLDLDRDGARDDRLSEHWAAGFSLLIDEVRAKLPPGTPIISNPGAQDCPRRGLDGILLEGWPTGSPYIAYAAGAARYASWSQVGRQLTIANGFPPAMFHVIQPGDDAAGERDYQDMRFGLASALMADGLFTFDNGPFGHYVAWWYDEYGDGSHWLGRALGPAHAEGALRWRELEHGLAVVNTGDAPVVFDRPGFARIRGTQDPVHNDGGTGPVTIAPHDGYVLRRLRSSR
jgi:hypothetical protein